ncbi:MAG TPA: glycoside hydrolase family 44 protein [Candidatus Dormibacteraeota bacterium]|nr:glycoside hydrolase family 44 protein [Candidatus Dormibacteraeota bacterium]
MTRLLPLLASFLAGCIFASVAGMYMVVAHPRFVARVEAHLPRFDFSSGSTDGGSQAVDTVPLDGVIVRLDTLAPGSPISPLIYGVAFADPAYAKELGATVNRWGGNSATTFNWDNGHAWNAGRDWEFRNNNGGRSGNAVDTFIQQSLAVGAQPLITIPTIGWVAKNDDNNAMASGVPGQGGPPVHTGSDSIAGYTPTANRARTSLPSLPKSVGPYAPAPNPNASVVYEDAWVHYLVSKFGSGPKGVTYFAMDNEPDLWSTIHTDVHPVQTSYDEMLKEFVTYADAVRAADPQAKILGPVVSGWTGYQFSALDRGSDNYATHADRQAHGDMPLLEWWLGQVAQHDRATGTRSLNYLDVHYYPQAGNVSSAHASDPATQALRIRSVRSLWDPTYSDESWIAQPVDLLPMLRAWINKEYPGTGISISEYNFGGEYDASGAVTLAEVLGVYGRYGVSMANYWPYPPANTPGEAAFKLYRNYDGKGGTFGDIAIPVTSASHQVAAFASRHSDTGEIDLVLANENLTQSATVSLQLGGGQYKAQQFVIHPGSSQISPEVVPSLSGPLTLEPLSVRLVRLTRS